MADKQIDYDAEMKLPPGKTCAQCVHIARCVGKPERTACDFHPSKFKERLTLDEQLARYV